MPGFEIGHLVVIFFIAFLVLGPDRMVEIARGLGKFTQQAQSEWWKFSQSFQEGLKNEPEKPDALPASTTETSEAPAAATQPAETSQPASPSDEAGASSSAAPTTATPAPTAAASTTKRPKAKKQTKPSPQSIPDHLLELRRRLITSLVAIVIFTTIGYIFSDTLLYVLRAPAGNIQLQALSPMDGFLIKFRIALYAGLYLSAPVWVYEIMMFVYPGLNPQEARLIIPGVIGIVILFLLGNIFGYLMLSNMMSVILSMFGSELKYLPSADPFISFVIFFLAATGIAFELPIALLILIRLGLISHQTLRKQRKISYFVIFVFAELITPVADPIVAPTVVMIPMIVLFEIALLVARLITPKPTTVPASGSSTSS